MSKLRMGKPIFVAQTEIIPIEMVSVGNFAVERGCWMCAIKKPVAVIVCDPDGVKVLDMKDEKWSLTELVSKVPGLESALAQVAAFRE